MNKKRNNKLGRSMNELSINNAVVYDNGIDQSNLVITIISFLDSFRTNINIETLASYAWYPINFKGISEEDAWCAIDSDAWVGKPKDKNYEQHNDRRSEQIKEDL